MKRAITALALALLLPFGPAQASVLCVQEFLLETAFNPGPADGAWGRRTATAVEEYVAQAGLSVGGGLERDNVDAMCALFTGDRHRELLELGAFRVYPVTIDVSMISQAASRTIFDFSKFDVATDANFDCRFSITRRAKSTGHIERNPLVDGEVTISNGRLEFGDHRWYVHGQSDETYLAEEANLRLTRNGQIVGMTPYFHMFWDRNEPGEMPIYVTFSRAYTAEGPFPDGLNEFDVEGPMEDGRFNLSCGTVAAASTAFDGMSCTFSLEREEPGRPPAALAHGRLTIAEGKVGFSGARWGHDLRADPEAFDRAKLTLTDAGALVGAMEVYFLFGDGHSPRSVLLDGASTTVPGNQSPPNGVTRFAIDDEWNGALKVANCRHQ